jgi:hypothetical protein
MTRSLTATLCASVHALSGTCDEHTWQLLPDTVIINGVTKADKSMPVDVAA